MSTKLVNRARLEVERMGWDEYLADPDGDRERALRRSHACTAFWRAAWAFTAAVLFCVVVLVLAGVL